MLSALAAPFAAFIAVGVALWQGYLQKQQLKQNLYQKRLEVCLSLRKFLSDIAVNGNTDLGKAFQLLRDTKESEFLFRPEVGKFVDGVYTKAIRFRRLTEKENALLAGGTTLQEGEAAERDGLSARLGTTAMNLYRVATENEFPRQPFTSTLTSAIGGASSGMRRFT